MQLAEIGNPTYIVLETFRKSGEGVKTPVWVAAEDGKLYVWTVDNSGKVKRIRNNGRVRLAVSDSHAAPPRATGSKPRPASFPTRPTPPSRRRASTPSTASSSRYFHCSASSAATPPPT